MDLFALLAVIGLALSLAVHGATFFDVDVQAHIPYVWLLHIGVFVVFIPAVILQNQRLKAMKAVARGPRASRDVFYGMPRWIGRTVVVLFAYTMVNFGLFMYRMEGSPSKRPDGTYELSEHGRLIRRVTAAEYRHFRALEVRGFSGHWMLFYAVSALLIFGRRYPVAAVPEPDASELRETVAVAGEQTAPGPHTGHTPHFTIERHSKLGRRWSMAFFLGPPLLFMFWIRPTFFPAMRSGVVGLWWLGSAALGALAAHLVWRAIPAQCPRCGGPAYLRSDKWSDQDTYRCRRCGRVSSSK